LPGAAAAIFLGAFAGFFVLWGQTSRATNVSVAVLPDEMPLGFMSRELLEGERHNSDLQGLLGYLEILRRWSQRPLVRDNVFGIENSAIQP
jgi:hypothetical protein